MITNASLRNFDVIQITNEMPSHRNGGVGTVIENLMTGLRDEGISVLWFLVDHGYLQWQVEDMLGQFENVAVGTATDLSQFRADVFHLHSYCENVALEAHLAGKRTVYTVHSLLELEATSNDVDLRAAVAWQKSLIRRSSAVALISTAERQRYEKLGYLRLNSQVHVIHNGLRPPVNYRTPRGRRTLGYCGRLVPRKHPEYPQLLLNEPDFEAHQTLIAGRGFSTYAKALLARHGLEQRVKYLGWCAGERLEAFYDAIDVLAVPSVYEPFGLVAIEASARGIPVIATQVDGLAEVLGEHAFYCSDTSFAAFCDAARSWNACSGQGLAELCAGAHERYLYSFTDRIMSRRYRDLFEQLTS